MTATNNLKTLPYVDIQHDALNVFDDVEQGIVVKEDIWVSVYKQGSPSVHGRVAVEARDGGGVDVAPRDGVTFERQSKTNFLVSAPSLDATERAVRFPRQVLSPPFTKPTPTSQDLRINSVAVSKLGELAIGGPDGYCVVLSPSDPASALHLKGHVGDVLHVQWFPSGEVVLTASSDLTLRIFSSKTGINPRTLKGHTRAITCAHIVGVGRHVLSGSKDGSVRLWDVGQGAEVKKWSVEGGKAVEGMAVVEDSAGLEALGVMGDDERVILAATPDGAISAFLLSSDAGSAPLFTAASPTSSKLVSVTYSPASTLLATGHADGTIVLRKLVTLVSDAKALLIKRNESPILSLLFDGEDLLVGTAAGLPCRLGVAVNPEVSVTVKEEYAGWESVAVETWAVASDGVWCAGSESSLRRY